MLTVESALDSVRSAVESNASEYMVKPVSLSDLEARLRKYLE
jgi:DNA-binding response OmpR family regulator